MFASRSHHSDESSRDSGAQGKRKAYSYAEPKFEHVELGFLRVVGRNKVPIIALDEMLPDFDGKSDGPCQYGATMEVHRKNWKGKGVVVKYIRRTHVGEAYRRAMADLNFELQLMSRPSLRDHRNIPKLLAVCFDIQTEDMNGSPVSTAHPGLVIELAHEQYPDIRHYFDVGHNPDRPARLPFETSSKFIMDIADGITALHNHDIVHADLKPENILLFPDPESPNALVAKVADFGFVGMTIYNPSGKRVGLPDGRPRGGTREWSAPECIENPDPFPTSGSVQHPSYGAPIDIYSFGLLSCYIALDGQTPIQYAPNLSICKTSDALLDIAVARLEDHYQDTSNMESSLKEIAVNIARRTLHLDWNKRIKSLRSIRGEISRV